MQTLRNHLRDANELYEMANAEQDADTVEIIALMRKLQQIADMEFRRMFSGEMDGNSAYMDIQSGQGTEAQIGPICCCACICVGVSGTSLNRHYWNYPRRSGGH